MIWFWKKKRLQIVNFHLQLDWSTHRTKHLVEILWPSYVRNHELSRADRRSLWSLISQPEYLTFSVLETAKVFPKILGTCGHVYATEYVIPFKLNTYFYGTLRAKILLHLSGTMKLFYDFLNEPLQWCDVKFENLGLHPDYPKRFLVMDGDMIFTESRMNALLASTKCRKDSDCEFFDCSSSCDYTSHRCTTRLNDNVEVNLQFFITFFIQYKNIEILLRISYCFYRFFARSSSINCTVLFGRSRTKF